jgi:hypothetical protein
MRSIGRHALVEPEQLAVLRPLLFGRFVFDNDLDVAHPLRELLGQVVECSHDESCKARALEIRHRISVNARTHGGG